MKPVGRWLQPPDTAITRRRAAAPVQTELEWGRPSISRVRSTAIALNTPSVPACSLDGDSTDSPIGIAELKM